MNLKPTGSQPDTSKVGTTLDVATEAKESLKSKLSGEGIKIGIGVEPLAQGTYGVALRVQPVHGVSAEQLAKLTAIESHDGVPVTLVQSGRIKPRS